MMGASSKSNRTSMEYVPSAPESSKVPIAPMGKLLTRLPRLTLAQLRTLRSTTGCTCCRDLAKFPSPRWDFHMFGALCLQGGGVYVQSGSVSFSSCTITGNTAYDGGGVLISSGTVSFSLCTITGNTAFSVRAHVQKFPSPDGIFTCFALCACRVAVCASTAAR